jgi:hypothetical protein
MANLAARGDGMINADVASTARELGFAGGVAYCEPEQGKGPP